MFRAYLEDDNRVASAHHAAEAGGLAAAQALEVPAELLALEAAR